MSSKRDLKPIGRPLKGESVQRDIFHFRATEDEGKKIRKAKPDDKTLSEYLRDAVLTSIEE